MPKLIPVGRCVKSPGMAFSVALTPVCGGGGPTGGGFGGSGGFVPSFAGGGAASAGGSGAGGGGSCTSLAGSAGSCKSRAVCGGVSAGGPPARSNSSRSGAMEKVCHGAGAPGLRSRPRRRRSRAAERQQVREKPVRSRHAVGKLAVERIGEVGVVSLAVSRGEPAALLRVLALVVGGDERRVGGVPGGEELRPALLDPPLEVRERDLVGLMQHRLVRSEDLHR